MLETEKYGVEQTGFLLQSSNGEFHFEMSGGEFCGNAARSAAIVISQITNKPENSFTMSGYAGVVQSRVIDDNYIRCEFKGLPVLKREVSVEGSTATLVDLGGIVHVVIKADFPKEYEVIHKQITQSLKLQDKDAVGVIWIKQNADSVKIDPVVWVRSIDTFFYETACGSGTIAVSATTGVQKITQPSGQDIVATIANDSVVLESAMDIVFEEKEAVQYVQVFDLN